jgi:hypothetical protein
MTIEIKTSNEYWFAVVTVKSGNRYVYNSVFHQEPSKTQIQRLWQESRKHWNRIA